MLIRYYDCDWSVPCIENELLFAGNTQECVQYLLKHWSVDVQEYKDNPELQALFCDYLRHIQVGKIKCPTLYDDNKIKQLYEEDKSWDNKCDWHNIKPQQFIFNRELIEILS